MIDMIGVGPFITIPLIIGAMGGPQAMIGWVLGAFLAICDGLIWAEFGAAIPGSGGSYRYLKEAYGPKSLGRLLSFLFIWQLSFSAPLSIASGAIGSSRYASYIWPSLDHQYASGGFALNLPVIGLIKADVVCTRGTFLSILLVVVAVFLLYRRITLIGHLSKILAVGVLGTIGWVIFAGVTHFNAARAFDFPPNAFHLDNAFFLGLGAALLVSAYDYWGYYNVCFIGDEIENPGRTIPRALIYSILAVAAIYIVMNISILGVIPWRELQASATTDTRFYTASILMERTYGVLAARIVSVLIMWTAFASVFSLLLGYSRVPYAAAQDGNYFKIFSKVHPRFRFPHVSLLALGVVAGIFCFFRLKDVIDTLVVIRIMIQFLIQAVGLIVLRVRRPDLPRPFRMWLYPIPALIAAIGFLYVMFMRPNFQREISLGVVIVIAGVVIYLIRSRYRREWPFAASETTA